MLNMKQPEVKYHKGVIKTSSTMKIKYKLRYKNEN